MTCSLTAFAQAQVIEIASARDQSAAIRALEMFEKAVASPTVPGISAALADKDGVIWAEGFGWADLENRVPMSTQTKMRMGSVAKPLTAAALMRLYDEGKWIWMSTSEPMYLPGRNNMKA